MSKYFPLNLSHNFKASISSFNFNLTLIDDIQKKILQKLTIYC